MTLRMLEAARGGHAAEAEMQRMMTEKGVAFAEAATTLATGGSMNKVVRRVRSRVNQARRPRASPTQRRSPLLVGEEIWLGDDACSSSPLGETSRAEHAAGEGDLKSIDWIYFPLTPIPLPAGERGNQAVRIDEARTRKSAGRAHASPAMIHLSPYRISGGVSS